METNRQNYNTILYLKFLQALLVCEDLTEFLKEADELGLEYHSISLLEMFREIITAYTNNHSLPPAIERNALGFIHLNRFYQEEESKEEKSKRVEICNDMIASINRSRGSEEYPFYPALINHLYHGFISKTWNHYLYAKSPDAMKELFNSYIAIEYYILYSHAGVLSDKEFLIFACEFLLNGGYLEAIQFLLDEIPELENDPVFIKRIKKILTENENLLHEYEGQPVSESESYLEDGDDEYIKDKYFWKLHHKVKTKVNRLPKDS